MLTPLCGVEEKSLFRLFRMNAVDRNPDFIADRTAEEGVDGWFIETSECDLPQNGTFETDCLRSMKEFDSIPEQVQSESDGRAEGNRTRRDFRSAVVGENQNIPV